MRNLFLILLIFFTSKTWGQNYSLKDIPQELKEKANAIILKEQTEVTIEKLNKVTTKKHLIVAILNSQGAELFDQYTITYDKFSKVKKLEANLYNAQGILIQKSKNSDIKDFANNPLGNEITDNRIKLISIVNKNLNYEYILEYITEEESTQTLFYENWTPINYYNTAIIESRHILRTAPEIKYRTRETNLSQSSKKTNENGFNVETWEIKNISPKTHESFSSPLEEPKVYIEPLNYQIEKYSGTINSWKDIGNFYTELNKGRDILPEATKQKIKELTQNETDPIRKAEKIYKYMQSHTRYFNVSIKLGGWQAVPANIVAEKGYGDCKALTNYTLAMLKEAGITAYPALVYAGSQIPAEHSDFPRNSFNHIIACIPTAKDTVWLECTSQTDPFGYLGSFTGNRKALLIKPNESEFVYTKSYLPQENFLKNSIEITLNSNATGKVKFESIYGGIQSESLRNLYLSKDRKKQEEWLKSEINVSDITIQSLEFSSINNDQEIKVSGNFESNKIGTISGDRLFFGPNILNSFFRNIPKTENLRTKDLYLNPNIYSIEDFDKVIINLPDGFTLENKSKDLELKENFGNAVFELDVSNPKQIIFTRKIKVKGGTYDKENFNTWDSFIKNINKADRQKVVLKKST